MNELQISFKAAMIRATVDGIKNQTRRTVKWRDVNPGLNLGFSGIGVSESPDGWVLESDSRTSTEWRCKPTPCPYGKPGDRLWVREAYRASSHFDKIPPRSIPHGAEIWYEATSVSKVWRSTVGKLRPSMFMCRWMSRITLEVVSVRIERLQEISEADARAEGITDGGCLNCGNPEPCGCGSPAPDARDSYCHLWEQINGPGSWALNPHVWVIEYKVVEQ